MLDMITIGDIKLDTFVLLHDANLQCELKMPECKLCLDYGAKIDVKIVDSQIAGSAPNVAVGLSRQKLQTAVLSVLGKDATEPLAYKVLEKEGVDTRYIKALKGEQSTYSVVLNFKGEKTILTGHIEHDYTLPKRMQKPKWLYVCELGGGYEKMYKEVIRYKKQDGVKIAANPGNIQIEERKKELLALFKHLEVLFVNKEEAQYLTKSKSLEIHKLAGALSKLGPKHVVITDGKNGAYEYNGKGLQYCPIFEAKLLEATGAGDAFATGFLGALLHGKECTEALRWGAVNAASSIEFVGPQKGLLSAAQIKKRLKAHPEFKIEQL